VPTIHSLGIEIGSLFVKAVGLDADGTTVWRYKQRHHGDALAVLERCLGEVNGGATRVGVAGGTVLPEGARRFDPVACMTAAARRSCPDARNILEVGGSNLTLVQLDNVGQILSIHANSLCAAGTGSFLDEQASRLGIDYDEADESPVADPPSIATRCAVFAKSDLIHRQQEGHGRAAMWSGLCRGLVDGMLQSLTHGRRLTGVTAVCGGVALNRTFVWWLQQALTANGNGASGEMRVVPQPEFSIALGAALLASNGHHDRSSAASDRGAGVDRSRTMRPPLVLERTRYPESTAFSSRVDEDSNEITLHVDPALHDSLPVFLGVDIGSTSTKCALVDSGGRMVLDVYRRTAGDPIGATRKLCQALVSTAAAHGISFEVLGAATTGSGRKLVGKVIGADHVVNEISAHGAGAVRLDPSVETVFEIGGQDAKYMAIRGGRIVDANMNYVCAAGTGSFIEELAAKLGYRTDEVGQEVLGVAPPYTSNRCTVFMEQDVLNLLRRGISRREALGSVVYSVVENYLERVVGRRHVNRKRVFFQGATARNRGLVAAIENVLGVEVNVSPYCHVMGAYGAALLAMERMGDTPTKFRGLSLGTRQITVEHEVCELCTNRCRLSRAVIEGESDRPAWGMVCGRDELDTRMRFPSEYKLFHKRVSMATRLGRSKAPAFQGRRIGIPRTLSTYSLLGFWRAFFEELNIEAVLSGPTDAACLQAGRECAGAELCLPVKVAHGHALQLLEQNAADIVFLPHIIAEKPSGAGESKLCPYVEAAPSMVKPALKTRGVDESRVASPVVDFRYPDRLNARRIAESLRPWFQVSQKDAERALQRGFAARRDQEAKLLELGQAALDRVANTGKPAVVVIGRPYNTLDDGIGLDIPYHIADSGIEVIPMDCLPFRPELLTGDFANSYWHYGKRILSALMQVARTDGLYAVYLTSFGCGPDSFLLTYAEAIMGQKPLLILELDEHGSSGGYQTRVEAFLDVVAADRLRAQGGAGQAALEVAPGACGCTAWEAPVEKCDASAWKRTVWVPPLHPVGHRLLAAAFRGGGYRALALPPEDDEAYAAGKRCVRGSECLPAPLTIGTFLKQMEREREKGGHPEQEAALFMPTADGPCRFGQYRTLHRMVLDREGYAEVPIISPSSSNTYYGLDDKVRDQIWGAVLASDILFKMRCRVRPYELTRGDAEGILETWTRKVERALESSKVDWPLLLRDAMDDFLRVRVEQRPCPLVGLVGEIYIRCNPYANSQVVAKVEELGGEVWLTPAGEWIEYAGWVERYMERQAGWRPVKRLKALLKWRYLTGKSHAFYKVVRPLLHDREEPPIAETIAAASRILPPEFQGEAILTVGRTVLFKRDGADLVINCAPFGCMPGNITTAIFEQMRETIGIPIVNTFYDGVEENRTLTTFLHQAASRMNGGRRAPGRS
jgi:predicted CoA-substrate-specific enzyme activase